MSEERCFVLSRRLSSYTADDLLLGVFRTRADVTVARREYLGAVVHGGSDPWMQQAYHVVSDDDVRVDALPASAVSGDDPSTVFVIASYEEGFGQGILRFECIAGTATVANALAKQRVVDEDAGFATETRIYAVPVGQWSRGVHGYPPTMQIP